MGSKLLSHLSKALPVVGQGLLALLRFLLTPMALPLVVWVLCVGCIVYQCRQTDAQNRSAQTYQDSIIRAQDSELWALRADTLQANFEIRELYNRLDEREKQEVVYFQQLRRANDDALQSALDSVFNRYARATSPGGYPLLSGSVPGAGYPRPAVNVCNADP